MPHAISTAIALSAAAFCPLVGAATIHVPADQPTIKAAVLAASSGDEIVVADGLYSGPDNRAMDFAGKNLVLRSAGGAAACTIDCEQLGRAFEFRTGETSASVIEGFTFANGKAIGAPNRGGALLLRGSIAGAGPTIRDCVFLDNSAGIGGAISIYQTSSPLIERCQFIGNVANNGIGGGAIHTENATAAPVIQECAFVDNFSIDCGGALLVSVNCSATVLRCDFIDNTCQNLGGAIYNPTISASNYWNCRFHGNSANNSGGGVAIVSGATASVVNCVFSGNSSNNIGGGAVYLVAAPAASFVNCSISGNSTTGSFGGSEILAFSSNGSPISNSIVWGAPGTAIAVQSGAGPTITRSIVAGGYVGEGNLASDPLFVDLDGADDMLGTLDDDLRVAEGSPAIDSGSNMLFTVALSVDLAGTRGWSTIRAWPTAAWATPRSSIAVRTKRRPASSPISTATAWWTAPTSGRCSRRGAAPIHPRISTTMASWMARTSASCSASGARSAARPCGPTVQTARAARNGASRTLTLLRCGCRRLRQVLECQSHGPQHRTDDRPASGGARPRSSAPIRFEEAGRPPPEEARGTAGLATAQARGHDHRAVAGGAASPVRADAAARARGGEHSRRLRRVPREQSEHRAKLPRRRSRRCGRHQLLFVP
jgi:hypothetical protein